MAEIATAAGGDVSKAAQSDPVAMKAGDE